MQQRTNNQIDDDPTYFLFFRWNNWKERTMAHNWKERKSSFLSLLLSIERCDGKVVLWVFAMERLWCLVVSKWALRRFLSVIV